MREAPRLPDRRNGRPPFVLDRSAAAPLLSLAGLAVAAAFSLGLLFGRFDLGIGGGPGGEGGSRTPNPSVVFTPAPSPDATPAFAGTILFAQEGSIWSISGHEVRRISSGSRDSMPAWTSDGQAIVFIETRTRNARVPTDGRYQTYILDYPSVMRMTAAGTDRTVIKDGLIKLEGGSERYYFTWLLQPDVSPDGKTIALVSDAPKPFDQDVTLSLLPMTGGKVDNLGVRQERPLGHNDPDWSPDGTRLAFTYNARDASLGTPKVGILTLKGAKLRFLVSGGYAQPSWSPDGRFLAAVRTTGDGRDIVIVRVKDGAVLDRFTADGRSFAPAWSPDGTGIAYLNITREEVDLRLLLLGPPAAAGGAPTLRDDIALTADSRLDPGSRPSWFIPPELLPTPSPSAAPSGSGSPAGSAAPSVAP